MSPVVFWAALIAAVYIAGLLAAAPPHNLAQVSGSAVALTTAAAMAWHRWMRKPPIWLWKVAAAAAALVLVALIHDWALRTDAFVIYRRNCPPRMGTFWPLIFAWLGGAALQSYLVWGLGIKAPRPAWRRALWGLLIVPWTLACAYVFARNINPEALSRSLWQAGKLIGSLAGGIAVIIGIGKLLTLPGRKARAQAAADYARIDPATRDQLLASIDAYARMREQHILYRQVPFAPTSLARIGGAPLLRQDESWPIDEAGAPAVYLLQLPLLPPLPASWEGRLLVVYVQQYELEIRSYAQADIAALAPRTPPATPWKFESASLQPIALPAAQDDGEDDDAIPHWDLERIVDEVPGLKAALEVLTRHPSRVLAMMLGGNAQVRGFDTEDTIIVGGAPALIQGAHDPACAICGQAMRFLFQFADVTETFELGDCGVGYVYGCDAHPEHCQGFVDCF